MIAIDTKNLQRILDECVRELTMCGGVMIDTTACIGKIHGVTIELKLTIESDMKVNKKDRCVWIAEPIRVKGKP